MIAVAEQHSRTGVSVSVAEASVAVRDEVKSMSATTIDRRIERRIERRPSILDRLVMRVSLAMLLWARRHAERAAVPREEQSRRYQVRLEIERREHATMLLTRMF